jgi:hypothetical protein
VRTVFESYTMDTTSYNSKGRVFGSKKSIRGRTTVISRCNCKLVAVEARKYEI